MGSYAAKQYSKNEELANAITHGIGILLAVSGLVVLVIVAAIYGDAWKVTSSAIYGSSMIILYTASTFYHAIQKPKVKNIMHMADHISIYYLIAGTYTPFVLVNLRGAWGWSIFGIIWGLAIVGTVLKLIYGNKLRKVSTIIYVGMGWVIIIAIKPMIDSISFAGLMLLFAGGVFYTGGVVFYKWKTLPFNHAIWHLFVLGGSVCHFFAILFYVVLD